MTFFCPAFPTSPAPFSEEEKGASSLSAPLLSRIRRQERDMMKINYAWQEGRRGVDSSGGGGGGPFLVQQEEHPPTIFSFLGEEWVICCNGKVTSIEIESQTNKIRRKEGSL